MTGYVKVNSRRLDQIREFLSRPHPGPSKEWARELLDRHARGENLSIIQIELATAALEPHFTRRSREPGEEG